MGSYSIKEKGGQALHNCIRVQKVCVCVGGGGGSK